MFIYDEDDHDEVVFANVSGAIGRAHSLKMAAQLMMGGSIRHELDRVHHDALANLLSCLGDDLQRAHQLLDAYVPE